MMEHCEQEHHQEDCYITWRNEAFDSFSKAVCKGHTEACSSLADTLHVVLDRVAPEVQRIIADKNSVNALSLVSLVKDILVHLHLRQASLARSDTFNYWDYVSALLSVVLDLKLLLANVRDSRKELRRVVLDMCFHLNLNRHQVWDAIVQGRCMKKKSLTQYLPEVVDKLVSWCRRTVTGPAQYLKFIVVVSSIARCTKVNDEQRKVLKKTLASFETKFDFHEWFFSHSFSDVVSPQACPTTKKLVKFLFRGDLSRQQLHSMCATVGNVATINADLWCDDSDIFCIDTRRESISTDVTSSIDTLEGSLKSLEALDNAPQIPLDDIVDSETVSSSSELAEDPQVFLESYLTNAQALDGQSTSRCEEGEAVASSPLISTPKKRSKGQKRVNESNIQKGSGTEMLVTESGTSSPHGENGTGDSREQNVHKTDDATVGSPSLQASIKKRRKGDRKISERSDIQEHDENGSHVDSGMIFCDAVDETLGIDTSRQDGASAFNMSNQDSTKKGRNRKFSSCSDMRARNERGGKSTTKEARDDTTSLQSDDSTINLEGAVPCTNLEVGVEEACVLEPLPHGGACKKGKVKGTTSNLSGDVQRHSRRSDEVDTEALRADGIHEIPKDDTASKTTQVEQMQIDEETACEDYDVDTAVATASPHVGTPKEGKENTTLCEFGTGKCSEQNSGASDETRDYNTRNESMQAEDVTEETSKAAMTSDDVTAVWESSSPKRKRTISSGSDMQKRKKHSNENASHAARIESVSEEHEKDALTGVSVQQPDGHRETCQSTPVAMPLHQASTHHKENSPSPDVIQQSQYEGKDVISSSGCAAASEGALHSSEQKEVVTRKVSSENASESSRENDGSHDKGIHDTHDKGRDFCNLSAVCPSECGAYESCLSETETVAQDTDSDDNTCVQTVLLANVLSPAKAKAAIAAMQVAASLKKLESHKIESENAPLKIDECHTSKHVQQETYGRSKLPARMLQMALRMRRVSENLSEKTQQGRAKTEGQTNACTEAKDRKSTPVPAKSPSKKSHGVCMDSDLEDRSEMSSQDSGKVKHEPREATEQAESSYKDEGNTNGCSYSVEKQEDVVRHYCEAACNTDEVTPPDRNDSTKTTERRMSCDKDTQTAFSGAQNYDGSAQTDIHSKANLTDIPHKIREDSGNTFDCEHSRISEMSTQACKSVESEEEDSPFCHVPGALCGASNKTSQEPASQESGGDVCSLAQSASQENGVEDDVSDLTQICAILADSSEEIEGLPKKTENRRASITMPRRRSTRRSAAAALVKMEEMYCKLSRKQKRQSSLTPVKQLELSLEQCKTKPKERTTSEALCNSEESKCDLSQHQTRTEAMMQTEPSLPIEFSSQTTCKTPTKLQANVTASTFTPSLDKTPRVVVAKHDDASCSPTQPLSITPPQSGVRNAGAKTPQANTTVKDLFGNTLKSPAADSKSSPGTSDSTSQLRFACGSVKVTATQDSSMMSKREPPNDEKHELENQIEQPPSALSSKRNSASTSSTPAKRACLSIPGTTPATRQTRSSKRLAIMKEEKQPEEQEKSLQTMKATPSRASGCPSTQVTTPVTIRTRHGEKLMRTIDISITFVEEGELEGQEKSPQTSKAVPTRQSARLKVSAQNSKALRSLRMEK